MHFVRYRHLRLLTRRATPTPTPILLSARSSTLQPPGLAIFATITSRSFSVDSINFPATYLLIRVDIIISSAHLSRHCRQQWFPSRLAPREPTPGGVVCTPLSELVLVSANVSCLADDTSHSAAASGDAAENNCFYDNTRRFDGRYSRAPVTTRPGREESTAFD